MLNILFERKEFFIELLLEHIRISLIAILIAIIIGGISGILISEYERIAKPTLAVVGVLYTIPSISMLGFLIPFSGVGNATAIIALTIYALLPMVRATYTGIKNVDSRIIEAAEGMGSTHLQMLYKIKLPLAFPVIMSGIRNMVTMTIALSGIASFIGAGGLGVAIYRGITTNNAQMTMAGSLLIALLALAVDFLLGIIERNAQQTDSSQKRKSEFKKRVALAVTGLCILAVVFSSINFKKKDTINIATKPMTEQYILGNMLSLLIEQDTDLEVEITQGVGGGTSNIQPGMEKAEFDLYPEYTGTGWNMVLGNEGIYSEDLFDQLKDEYHEEFGFAWHGMLGFNNTYGMVVRTEVAEEFDLKTYSDLAKVSDQLIFGANYDFFEREDGYEAVIKAYNMNFKQTMDLDIGLKYQAINQGKIDVLSIFTTDGQLSQSDVVVLEDDLHFYPSYRCGIVIREEVLDKHPELEDVFQKLEGSIDDNQMSKMNDLVESQDQEPEDVAREYLTELGLLN